MALEDPKKLTYGYLQKMVVAWLNRNDLSVDLVKDFIALAERKIFRQLRCPMNEKLFTTSPLAGPTDYLTLPGDFIEAKDLNINGKEFRFKPYNIWLTSRDCNIYTRLLGNLLIKPEIPKEAKIRLMYYFDATGMNDDEESNNVLRTCPDLYLYASLIQAESFLINDERIALWKGLYDVTLEEVNRGYKNLDYRGNLVIME